MSEDKRKTLSKKLRFEIFKRDSFTCQYCGRMAPDVILEIDHINPVKHGGKNDILNLITSCRDCNRGKGAKELMKNQVLKQQQDQLKELNEKREQLKLMLKWKEELDAFEDEQVDIINNILNVSIRCELSEFGKKNMKKHIKKYGIQEVIEATNLSINQYYDENKEETVAIMINYIPRICANRLKNAEDPWRSKRFYIKGIIKNRFGVFNEKRLMNCITDIVTDKESYEYVISVAKNARNWSSFFKWINEDYGGNW